eukprot:TRINITY_DN4661_c0_g1_i1.p1 TRINITY_DN4661_c0_g1~~TRINITY_DN4661_c0_g1_i1.p1  ORF type:complete len:1583 (-),score=276.52 TRINITY_DN4661_c0_g1_i1:4-4752(-)
MACVMPPPCMTPPQIELSRRRSMRSSGSSRSTRPTPNSPRTSARCFISTKCRCTRSTSSCPASSSSPSPRCLSGCSASCSARSPRRFSAARRHQLREEHRQQQAAQAAQAAQAQAAHNAQHDGHGEDGESAPAAKPSTFRVCVPTPSVLDLPPNLHPPEALPAAPLILVKWAGLPYSQCSWEPIALVNNDAKILEFYQQNTLSATDIRVLQQTAGPSDPMLPPPFNPSCPAPSAPESVSIDFIVYSLSLSRNVALVDLRPADSAVQIPPCAALLRALVMQHSRTTIGTASPLLILVPEDSTDAWYSYLRSLSTLRCAVLSDKPDHRPERWVCDAGWHFYCSADDSPSAQLHRLPQLLKFDALIASYAAAMNESAALSSINWSTVALTATSAHMASPDTEQSAPLAQLLGAHLAFISQNARARLVLCSEVRQSAEQKLGSDFIVTPALHPLFSFLDPVKFANASEFQAQISQSDFSHHFFINRADQATAPQIRELHMQVSIILSPPSPHQRLALLRLLRQHHSFCTAQLAVLSSDPHKMANMHSVSDLPSLNPPRLRTIEYQLLDLSTHPSLLGADGEIVSGGRTPDDRMHFLIQSSGKLVVLDRLLPRLKEQGHKVILCVSDLAAMDVAEDYLSLRHFPFCRIDTRSAGSAKHHAVDLFQSPTSGIFICLLSLRTPEVARLNLSAATVVLFLDSCMAIASRPECEAAALRATTNGSNTTTPNVNVFRILCERTYEAYCFAQSQAPVAPQQHRRLLDYVCPAETHTALSTDEFALRCSTLLSCNIDFIFEHFTSRTAAVFGAPPPQHDAAFLPEPVFTPNRDLLRKLAKPELERALAAEKFARNTEIDRMRREFVKEEARVRKSGSSAPASILQQLQLQQQQQQQHQPEVGQPEQQHVQAEAGEQPANGEPKPDPEDGLPPAPPPLASAVDHAATAAAAAGPQQLPKRPRRGGREAYNWPCCEICEDRGEMLICDGPCMRSFHPHCLGMPADTVVSQKWVCDDCRLGMAVCFACKKKGKMIIQHSTRKTAIVVGALDVTNASRLDQHFDQQQQTKPQRTKRPPPAPLSTRINLIAATAAKPLEKRQKTESGFNPGLGIPEPHHDHPAGLPVPPPLPEMQQNAGGEEEEQHLQIDEAAVSAANVLAAPAAAAAASANQETSLEQQLTGEPAEDNPTVTRPATSEDYVEGVTNCTMGMCGRFYHLACVKKYKLTNFSSYASQNRFRCPLHYCVLCERSGDSMAIAQCLRCPVSYHIKCLPRDSCYRLDIKLMLCPKHEPLPTTRVRPTSGKKKREDLPIPHNEHARQPAAGPAARATALFRAHNTAAIQEEERKILSTTRPAALPVLSVLPVPALMDDPAAMPADEMAAPSAHQQLPNSAYAGVSQGQSDAGPRTDTAPVSTPARVPFTIPPVPHMNHAAPPVCKACGSAGQLIHCSDCRSHFHRKCVSPPVSQSVRTDWRCPDCFLDRDGEALPPGSVIPPPRQPLMHPTPKPPPPQILPKPRPVVKVAKSPSKPSEAGPVRARERKRKASSEDREASEGHGDHPGAAGATAFRPVRPRRQSQREQDPDFLFGAPDTDDDLGSQ